MTMKVSSKQDLRPFNEVGDLKKSGVFRYLPEIGQLDTIAFSVTDAACPLE